MEARAAFGGCSPDHRDIGVPGRACALDANRPNVIEPAPYGTPPIAPAPEPMHDPSGRVISI